MNIPESIALQGVEIVQEYKDKKCELDNLRQQIYDVAEKIKKVEKEIQFSLDDFIWNRPNSYYKDWKTRNVVKRHFSLVSLTEKHKDLTFEFVDLDNKYASLNLELYHKGWLPDWQQKEYTKLGFGM